MSLVHRQPALARSLCVITLLLAVPALSQAAPNLGGAAGPLRAGLQGQINVVPSFPADNFGLPPFDTGGPNPNPIPLPNPNPIGIGPSPFGPQPGFIVNPIPIGPNLPTGQYGLGINGTFVGKGMLVQQVTAGSPAAKIGLLPGDVVLKMDGVVISNQQLFNQVLSSSGGVIQMIVQRKNQVVQLTVPLTVDGPRIQAPYLLGVRGTFGFNGMTINKVYTGTPAQQIGLKVGDQIVSINNIAMTNNQVFYQALHNSSGNAVLQVIRQGQKFQPKVRLELCRFGSLGSYTNAGVFPELIHPDTPASRAGFQGGEWIQSVDGKLITNQTDFVAAMNQSGGNVVMQVKPSIGPVTQVPVELMNNSLGCWCQPALGGMRLLNAPQGTMSQAIGLIKGDIILQVDNVPTGSLGILQKALENARGTVTIDYRSVVSGQLLRLNVNLGLLFQ